MKFIPIIFGLCTSLFIFNSCVETNNYNCGEISKSNDSLQQVINVQNQIINGLGGKPITPEGYSEISGGAAGTSSSSSSSDGSVSSGSSSSGSVASSSSSSSGSAPAPRANVSKPATTAKKKATASSGYAPRGRIVPMDKYKMRRIQKNIKDIIAEKAYMGTPGVRDYRQCVIEAFARSGYSYEATLNKYATKGYAVTERLCVDLCLEPTKQTTYDKLPKYYKGGELANIQKLHKEYFK